MITSSQLLDLYDLYKDTNIKMKEILDNRSKISNKDAISYYINSSMCDLLWHLYVKSAQNDEIN